MVTSFAFRRRSSTFFSAHFLPTLGAASLLLTLAHGQNPDSPEADPAQLPRIAPTEPAGALETFQIKPGYALDLVACEPQVVDPIAMAWDAQGRLFVVEMRGYSERREESLGRIRLLEDRDADGVYETSHVYAENLEWPTGLLCYDEGLFVVATPDLLYFRDTDGDGKADHREVVFTGFGEGQDRLNVQALANGLAWGADGRVYGATAMNGARLRRPQQEEPPLVLRGSDFSFDPRTRELRAEPGGGQYGLTFDDWGNRFVCSNSHHMQWIAHQQTVPGLPSALVDIPDDGPAAEVFRISPDEPWRLVRTRWRVQGQVAGPVEGGGRVSGYFTAATGICSHEGRLFTADAGSNLIHHKTLDWENRVQPIARRLPDETQREILASRDNWFRPVYLASGPDGALYIADMYREIIEHPWSLPEGLKKHLDLNSGNDRGRIYRLRPDTSAPVASVPLASLDLENLVDTLADPIAWRRRTAARLLHQHRHPGTAQALRQFLPATPSPEARFLALHLLDAFEGLQSADLQRALTDPEPWIRALAIRLAVEPGSHASESPATDLASHMPDLVQDPSPQVRFAALQAAAHLPLSPETLGKLVRTPQSDPWCRAAAQAVIGPAASELLAAFLTDADTEPPATLVTLAATKEVRKDLFAKLPDHLQLAYLAAAAEARHQIQDLISPEEQTRLLKDQSALALAPDQPLPQRTRGVTLLGSLENPQALATLHQILSTTESEALARHTLDVLGRRPDFDPASALATHWPRWSPATRSRGIDLCLGSAQSVSALLDHVESGIIPRSSLSGGQVTSLQNTGPSESRLRARALLAPKTKAEREQAVVQARPALTLTGNPEHGRLHYQQRCASCHDEGKESGQSLGPPRAALAQNGPERLLINLIDPNREVLPSYFASVITRKDGTAVSGLVTSDAPDALTLRQPLGQETTIARTEIDSLVTEQQSLMPEGLEAGLSHQDLADLLSYISAPSPAP